MSAPQDQIWLRTECIKVDLKSPLLLVHGGAGPQDPQGPHYLEGQSFLRRMLSQMSEDAPVDSIQDLQRQWTALSQASRKSLSAVWAMESEPLLNAGLGASLQADGVARVSASFMESGKRAFSAVMNATDLEHPSQLAWWLQRERFSVLDSVGVRQLSDQLQVPRRTIVTENRFNRWIEHKRKALHEGWAGGRSGTVGAVAVDSEFHLAATTSTGGVGNETPGRVGDSPTIAGNYCTRRVAVSCTGIGEQIMAHAVGPRLALAVEKGDSLDTALRDCFQSALQEGYRFAAIAIATQPEKRQVQWAVASSRCLILWGLKNQSDILVE
ncbi:MAG: isoaspartyl peptidase/L-asparaginase [Bdellovibrionales bacterium]